MTVNEAIKLVKEVTGMSLDWDDAHYDALQMAIKALEQEPHAQRRNLRVRLLSEGLKEVMA